MCLTDEELVSLTRKSQRAAQCRVLDAMGIPYKPRGDGSPAVEKAVYLAIMGMPESKIAKPFEINWNG